MNLSNKDSASIATALKQAEALVGTLSKMVGADNGLLHMHAQDLQASALSIEGKLKLIQTVTSFTGE